MASKEDSELQVGVLQKFSTLIGTHRQNDGFNTPSTSIDCLERQQRELPQLFTECEMCQVCCTVPRLKLRDDNRKTSPTMMGKSQSSSKLAALSKNIFFARHNHLVEPEQTSAASSKSNLERLSVQNLGRVMEVTRQELPHLPLQMLISCVSTFEELWHARLRQAVKAFLSRGNNGVARRLARLLKQQSSAVVTILKTLDFIDRNHSSSGDIVLTMPAIFEVIMDWNLCDTDSNTIDNPNRRLSTTIKMEAPGVLQGHFHANQQLYRISLEFDTAAFLHSTIQQAKILLKSAVLAAAFCNEQEKILMARFPGLKTTGHEVFKKKEMLESAEIDSSSNNCLTVTEELVLQGHNGSSAVIESQHDEESDDEDEEVWDPRKYGEKTPLEELFAQESPSDQLKKSKELTEKTPLEKLFSEESTSEQFEVSQEVEKNTPQYQHTSSSPSVLTALVKDEQSPESILDNQHEPSSSSVLTASVKLEAPVESNFNDDTIMPPPKKRSSGDPTTPTKLHVLSRNHIPSSVNSNLQYQKLSQQPERMPSSIFEVCQSTSIRPHKKQKAAFNT